MVQLPAVMFLACTNYRNENIGTVFPMIEKYSVQWKMRNKELENDPTISYEWSKKACRDDWKGTESSHKLVTEKD